MDDKTQELFLRPYQLMCAVCSLGADDGASIDPRSSEILKAIRRRPDMPITLQCNTGNIYAYQDPGHEQDQPEGMEFNIRRDLEILHKLDLFPGCRLPARILFDRLIQYIESTDGICGYNSVTCDAWKGCPRASTGNYERGRAKTIAAIIPPRTDEEMIRDKSESMEKMRSAESAVTRPHLLMCAVCQYGSGVRPPYPEDNVPELLEMILENPDTPVTFTSDADYMMCGPCPYRSPDVNACVKNSGAGEISNQMRDLRVLQKLGVAYGSTLPGREIYRRIFSRISGTFEMCHLDHDGPSVWFTGCGPLTEDSEFYIRGRELLIDKMNLRGEI